MNNVERENVRPETDDAAAERHDAAWGMAPATVIGVVVGLALALAMTGGMFWIGDFFLGAAAGSTLAGKQKLAELQTAAERELNSYGWIDEQDGIVRVPIARAMELLARESAREAKPAGTSSTATEDQIEGEIP